MLDQGSHFLGPGKDWDNLLYQFSLQGLGDIYFDSRYLNLYLDKGSSSSAEAFVFRKNENTFFLPYIKQPVFGEQELWDFETAYGYSGPLSTSEDEAFLYEAWESFINMTKSRGFIAGLIRFNPLLENHKFCSSNSLKSISERQTVWLDCKRTIENVLSDYSKSHLKRLRNLEKNGVYVKYSNSEEYITQFREIYLQRMTKLDAREEYLFSKEYFQKILLMNKDNWKVYLAYSPGGEVTGGCLLLISNGTCHYHLSGSKSEFLKYKPNDVLRHNVIKDMIASNINKIHFGGGRTNDPDDSLLKFKLKFSKQKIKFRIGYCLIDEEKYLNVCKKWSDLYPEKNNYEHFFLKYRY